MRTQRCKNCIYSCKSGKVGKRECRSNPPTAHCVLAKRHPEADQYKKVTIWPEVRDDDWCGKHCLDIEVPKPEEEAEEIN